MTTNPFIDRWPTLYELGKRAREDSGCAGEVPNENWFVSKLDTDRRLLLDVLEGYVAPYSADVTSQPVPGVAADPDWQAATMDLLWDSYEEVLAGRPPVNEYQEACLAELRRRTSLPDHVIGSIGKQIGQLFDGDLSDVYRATVWNEAKGVRE